MALLLVFAIALTPFGALHHHHDDAPICTKDGKICLHKGHVSNHEETCLICKAHFEKNYTTHQPHYQLFQDSEFTLKIYDTIKGSYAELISQALRGPPAV